MKLLIAAGMAISILMGVVLAVSPAVAATDGVAIGDPAHFFAFSKLPVTEHPALRSMTDDELAMVEGAAGPWSFYWANLNLGIILQFNICAICFDVAQGNVAVLIQRRPTSP
jgi:hypothetical protein